MSDLTILESESFWDELIKREVDAEEIEHEFGRRRLKDVLRAAFELKREYDEKMKGDTA